MNHVWEGFTRNLDSDLVSLSEEKTILYEKFSSWDEKK